jgi:hypothetical protein
MPTAIALLTLLLLTVPATAEEARTFGTTDLTTHRIHAYAFTGFSPFDNAHVLMNSSGGRTCSSTSGCRFGAAVSLPTGARLERFALEACNATAGGVIEARVRRVTNQGVVSEIAAILDAAACQFYNVFPPPHTIDNDSNSYFVEIFIKGDAVTDSTRFQSVLFYYRLQVTPAPAVATFNDVPTNHPFFPFIEALVAAGITTGCDDSPPLFCPDGLVTRKQMAAFLARALGLHWAP